MTNSITTTSAMNSADRMMQVIAALMYLARRSSTGKLRCRSRAPGDCSWSNRRSSRAARAIDDARQPAGQDVQRDADGRDEEDRGERNLDEMRDIEGGVERDPRRAELKTPRPHGRPVGA